MNNKDFDIFDELDLINSQADEYRLQYLKDNPYEGTKTIFIIFYNFDGYINSKQIKKVFKMDFINNDYYEIGDASTDSSVFAKTLTHAELVEICDYYMSSSSAKPEEDKTEICTYFEYISEDKYKGYHFTEAMREDSDVMNGMLMEAEPDIIEYLNK